MEGSKKYLTILFVAVSFFNASISLAQDTIVLNSGEKRAVKIVSVDKEVVFTVPPSNETRAYYLKEVNYIKYADGSIFAPNPPANQQEIVALPRKLLTVSTDLMQYIVAQPNVGIDGKIRSWLYAGVNFGLVNTSSIANPNVLATEQYEDPGTVYTGYALRCYIKLFPSKVRNSYWSIQVVYKSLKINNVQFTDQYGDAYDNIYTINEHATTIGFDLLHGNEIIGMNKLFDIDVFYGFGIHFRNRNYTISNQTFPEGYPYGYNNNGVALNGSYTGILTIPTPVVGFRIGFNYIKKK